MRRLLAVVLFALSACSSAGGVMPQAVESGQRVQRLDTSLWTPIVWNNQTPDLAFPNVVDGGGCWAQTEAIKPLGPWAKSTIPMVLQYDARRCGAEPVPFTVTWGKPGAASGCQFEVQYEPLAAPGSRFLFSSTGLSWVCAVSHHDTVGNVSITEVTLRSVSHL